MRVLILSADVGGGHDAAARGIADRIQQARPDAEVDTRNGLRELSATIHRSLVRGYEAQLGRAPGTYRLVYAATSLAGVAHVLRWLLWNLAERRMARLIEEAKPDLVVSTYPAITAILGKMRRTGQLDVPTVAVLIDSDPHDLWIGPGIDHHLALNDRDVARSRQLVPTITGVPDVNVRAIAPPVDRRYLGGATRAEARAAAGFTDNERIVFVSGGSWGVGQFDALVVWLADRVPTAIWLVACGRNEALRERLDALANPRVRGIGFTREIDAHMRCADVAILGAGGMTMYECFALGLPVVIDDPLPGHGEHGATAVDADGLALLAHDRSHLEAAASGELDRVLATQAAAARDLFTAPGVEDIVDELLVVQSLPPQADRTRAAARRGVKSAMRAAMLVALVIVGSVLWAQRHALQEVRWTAHPATLALAVAAFTAGSLLAGLSWWTLLREHAGTPRGQFLDALQVWTRSGVLRYAPSGVAGIAYRAGSQAGVGATTREVMASTWYEYVFLIAGAGIYAGSTTIFSGHRLGGATAAMLVGGVVAIALVNRRLLGRPVHERLSRLRVAPPAPLRSRVVAKVLAFQLGGWLLAALGASLVLRAVQAPHGHVPGMVALSALYTSAWLAGFLTPGAPGGFGVREAVLTVGLAPAYGTGLAAAAALVLRVAHTAGELAAVGIVELVQAARHNRP